MPRIPWPQLTYAQVMTQSTWRASLTKFSSYNLNKSPIMPDFWESFKIFIKSSTVKNSFNIILWMTQLIFYTPKDKCQGWLSPLMSSVMTQSSREDTRFAPRNTAAPTNPAVNPPANLQKCAQIKLSQKNINLRPWLIVLRKVRKIQKS